jgi:hypothetical protein
MAYVDAHRWYMKVSRVQLALLDAVKESIDFGMDEVFRAANRNLSGPHYKPGTKSELAGSYPVPIVTGTLRRSLRSKRLNPAEGVVYSDGQIANYNKHVHDGTRTMRPRRFLTDAVSERRMAIENRMRYNIQLAVRREGQS